MPILFDPDSKLAIGDPELRPLSGKTKPSPAGVAEAAGKLILSAAGWRKVFADHRSGNSFAPWIRRPEASASRSTAGDAVILAELLENSLSPYVSEEDLVVVGAMALIFGRFIARRTGKDDPSILVGIDTRPTGPAIADMMIRVLVALGMRVRYLFIVPAPEIMALAGHASTLPPDHEERSDGFVYISASHNPPGHNGVKFGAGSGGILSSAEIDPLIEEFLREVGEPDLVDRIRGLVATVGPKKIAQIYVATRTWKRRAISAYTLLAREMATGETDPDRQELALAQAAPDDAESAVGIVAEFNGSARTLSIDTDFLRTLGARVKSVNDEPRYFVHRIVPEGASLDTCRMELEAEHASNPAFVLGYSPDCDGDRGNLVWFDDDAREAKIIEAQQVFALCCLSEFATMYGAGTGGGTMAVAVNDATSMRIEAIARVFGVHVFRAETGEANVVGLADSLRTRGFLVRILGEGSNGGNITYPSRVRDPLATVASVLRLISVREGSGSESPFHVWMRLTGRESRWSEKFRLADVIASLPRYATTSVFEDRAVMKIRERDRAALRSRYRDIFLEDWGSRNDELVKRFGIRAYRVFVSSGIGEREAEADFWPGSGGGLRIVFSGDGGIPKAMLWMRGSGTEPVFRILADVAEGGRDEEEYFLSWQRSMVERADGRPAAR